jgi:hypothetical protein
MSKSNMDKDTHSTWVENHSLPKAVAETCIVRYNGKSNVDMDTHGLWF